MKASNRLYYFRIAGIACLLVGLLIAGLTAYFDSQKITLRLDDEALLARMWDRHKSDYWEAATGRTLDTQQNGITTSEGQSYTMMRAVWMNDRPTFDKAWDWTQQQLQHSDDALFAWRWGQRSDGSYGVLTDQGGQNSASDADIDIAFALLMAANRWQSPGYRDDARPIINSIWEEEVSVIQGKPYLLANDLEKRSASTSAIINPSYYAPYAFRVFAEVDPNHDWRGLVGASYDFLAAASQAPLDTGRSAGLPPDWVVINKTSGVISATGQPNLTTNFSYDAKRTVWRLALDYVWNDEDRAKRLLESYAYLAQAYERDQKLLSTYNHAGQSLTNDEVAAMYGSALGYFLIHRADLAEVIYRDKLRPIYAGQPGAVSYYSDNWAWFGMALANDRLTNFAD